MSDAFVKFTKKPLMCGRQDDNMTSRPDKLRCRPNLQVIIVNMFENIYL